MTATTQRIACPEHGVYVSEFTSIPVPGRNPMPQWSACPVCNIEHAQAARGQGRPSRSTPHRPATEVTP